MKKRLIMIAVLLAMIFVPASVFADSDVKYLDEKGVEHTATGCISVSTVPDVAYPVLGGSDGKEKWYVLDSDVTFSRYRLTVLGKVNLILTDGHKLHAGYGIRMAANNSAGAKLTVYAQSTGDKMGELKSDATDSDFKSCAGIGGNDAESSGEIIINGGKIIAYGGKNAAGIGGGEDRSADSITINGGDVTAKGGYCGAGIGGGEAGSGGTIKINGGIINAVGGDKGAGIGGGQKYRGGGRSGNITITGGNISAAGGIFAAAIGGGEDGGSDSIRIEGGEIKVQAGRTRDGAYDSGAAIGGGEDGNNESIKIFGGKISGTGRIGGGDEANGGDIYISGGDIRLYCTNGACIGGGLKSNGGQITILDGKIYAKAKYGAAIGGGDGGSAGDIRILGGDIHARGYGRPGIGGGRDNSSNDYHPAGSIYISGGSVCAFSFFEDAYIFDQASESNDASPGIGISSGEGVSITIDNGYVEAHGSMMINKGSTEDAPAIGAAFTTMSGPIHINGGTIKAYPSSRLYIGNGPRTKNPNDTSKFTFAYRRGRVYFGHGDGRSLYAGRDDRFRLIFTIDNTGYWPLVIEPCSHQGAKWGHDSKDHWRDGLCPDCGIYSDELAHETMGEHSFVQKSDSTHHWQECKTCGYKKDIKEHKNELTGHECTVCKTPMTVLVLVDGNTGEKIYKNGIAPVHNSTTYIAPPIPDQFKAPEDQAFLGWRLGTDARIMYMPGDTIKTSAKEIVLTTVYGADYNKLRKSIASGGDIKLDADYYLNEKEGYYTVPSGIKTTLDLNGHIIRRETDSSGLLENQYVFHVEGELTIKDSRGGGMISGGKGTTKNLFQATAGAAYVKGTLDLQGGTFENQIVTSPMGGAITVDGGTFRMSGGVITKSLAATGSGVYCRNHGKVELTGGQIINNIAMLNGSVYLTDNTCHISVSGNPVISGTRNMTGNLSNIYLQSGQTIAITGALQNTASIGVSVDKKLSDGESIQITSGLGANGTADLFTSDQKGLAFGLKDGEARLGSKVATVTIKKEELKSSKLQAEPADDIFQVLYVPEDMQIGLPECNIRPPEGKVFDKWIVNGEPHPAMDLFTVPGDVDVYPSWKDRTPGKHRVITTAGNGGIVIYYGTLEADTGENVDITAFPDEGYEFCRWEVRNKSVDLLDDETDFMNEFIMGDKDADINAVFQPIAVESVSLDKYDLFLTEGQSDTIELDVAPWDALNKNVTWDADEEIVSLTFDELGNAIVKGEKAGVAEILVQTEDGDHAAICHVAVFHNELKHIEASEPTLKADGNIEYWVCENCGKCYEDDYGFHEIDKADTVIKLSDEGKESLQAIDYLNVINKAEKKKVQIVSAKAKKGRKALVKWKKNNTADGYIVIYSTSKKFKKNVKIKYVKGKKNVKTTLKKLKKRKRYYVKAAPYTLIKNSGKTYKISGKNSSVKKFKTKKK